MSDTQFSREDRMRAMDAAVHHLGDTATIIARELSGQTTGPFARYLRTVLEDALRTGVFDADLPEWGEWQERAEEERQWQEAEARRAA